MKTIVFISVCIIETIAIFMLWHGPRTLLIKDSKNQNLDLYKGFPPPSKSLSLFGKVIEAVFYAGGILLLAIVFLWE